MDSTVPYRENGSIAHGIRPNHLRRFRADNSLNIPKEVKSLKAANPAAMWALMNKLSGLVRGSLKKPREIADLAEKIADELGRSLAIERCAVLLFSEEGSALEVKAEYAGGQKSALVGKTYHLGVRSEFVRLLRDGRPLPLHDILTAGASALETFVGDSKSGGVIAFPLLGHAGPIGCLTMHAAEGGHFSDEFIEICEALSQQVAIALDLAQTLQTRNRQASFFTQAKTACLIVDSESLLVLSANASAARLLTGASVCMDGVNLTDLLAPKKTVNDIVLTTINSGSAQFAQDLTLSAAKSEGGFVGLLAYPIHETDSHTDSKDQKLAVILYDQKHPSLLSKPAAQEDERAQQGENSQVVLSKQLTWERWMRQIVCRLHSSLDRDSIMQSVVDSLGRALSVSRCMVVRTESISSPIVTHEFAEPDVSPLGLGRTGQFPARTAGHFKTRVKAVGDIVAERPNLQISDEELEWFLDNGFSSIAGAPISHHGQIYGVVVAISCGVPRKWLPNELDMLEVAAAEAAIALENSQAFMQVKDQLFNMNLLGNLTQQLTNTLEMASRTNRPEGLEDKGRADTGGPPLSFRELEVLKLIASGLANREIAQRLFLTESTVELHASRIRKKLKLKSRTALVKYACDNDLV